MAYLNPNYSNEVVDDPTPFPVGKYPFTIKKAEVEKTKAGDGEKLKLMVVIRSGAKTRVEFVNINIVNPNPQAQEIGRRELTQLRMCAGLGEGELRDTDQLVGATGTVSATIEQNYQGEARNKLSSFRPAVEASGFGGLDEMEAPAPIKKAAPPTPTKEVASIFDDEPVIEKKKPVAVRPAKVAPVAPKAEADDGFTPWA